MRKAALALLLVSFGLVPFASAHPYTLDSSPPALSNGPVGTTEVIVHYSEALEVDFSALRVFDSGGNQIDNRDTSYYQGEESLVVTTPPLEEGVYTVTSKVLSKVDGHLVPDAFVFGIGDVVVQDIDVSTAELIFYPEAAARFPGLVGQTVVLGAAIASVLIWGTQGKDAIRSRLREVESALQGRFLAVTGAGIAAVFASNIMMLVIQTWRLETSALQALETSFGMTWTVRMGITAALLAAWLVLYRKGSRSTRSHIPVLAVSLVLISTTTMIGHGAASGQPAAVMLDYVHNLVAAAWIGGIIFFAFALLPALSGLGEDAKERMSLVLIPRFSIMVVISLGIVVISGPVLMWFLESNVGTIVESTYGKLIITKILIAAAMVGIGGYHQFGIQRRAERNLGAGTGVHKKLRRALKVESVLGIVLLGVVALLVNGTLPAGEIQSAGAQSSGYGFSSTEYSGSARFDIEVFPFTTGGNEVTVRVTDPQGGRIGDLGAVKIKVSNPGKNVTPIVIDTARTENGRGDEFVGEATFGFSGRWLVEVEAQRTRAANEAVQLDLLVKPRLENLRADVTEYDLPAEGKPFYPIFDGGSAIWFSDISGPAVWRFDMDGEEFERIGFEGRGSQALVRDHGGKIWFADLPSESIGYVDPETSEATVIGLPEIFPNNMASPPISLEVDGENNIWVTIISKGVIMKYYQGSGEFEEYRLEDQQGGPFALRADGRGNIWYSESATGKIGFINVETKRISPVETDFVIEGPEALIFDGDGNLWITEHTVAGIVRFDPVLGTFDRVPVTAAGSLPFGMAFDRYGNLWYAQHQIDLIGVYDPQSDEILDVPVPTEGAFVQFITADGDGNIWFAEAEAGKIGVARIAEVPSAGPVQRQGGGPPLQYTELASPLMSIGIAAAALFFVKSVRDKRRLNGKALGG